MGSAAMAVRRVYLDAGGVVLRLPHARERVWAFARAAGLQVGYGSVAAAMDASISEDAALSPHRDLITGRVEEDRRTLALYGRVARAIGLPAERAADLRDCASFAVAATLYPDVAVTLDGLAARGVPVGLISNAPPSLLSSLVRLDVAGRLSPVVVSWEVGATKPDPRIFAEAVRRAGVPASACLYVDDLPGNVAAARRAGMRAVALRRTPDDPADASGAPCINGLEAVLRLVEAGDGSWPSDLSLPQGLRLGADRPPG